MLYTNNIGVLPLDTQMNLNQKKSIYYLYNINTL